MADIHFGWAGEVAEKEALEKNYFKFSVFALSGDDNKAPRMALFDYVRKVNGKDLRNINQPIGDCVSRGVKNAVDTLACVEIARLGQAETFIESYSPFYYSTSRNAPETGNGQMGNSDGSTGTWGAIAANKYGTLPWGTRAYDAATCKRYGVRMPPSAELQEAKPRFIQSYARIRTADEAWIALSNGYPLTLASNQGYNMQGKLRDGKLWFVGSDSWSHQMAVCLPPTTEVLTLQGWKTFDKVTLNDDLATLNMQTKVLEYQKPTKVYEFDYNGDLVRLANNQFEFEATPDHRVIYQNKWSDDIHVCSADELLLQKRLPKTANNENADITHIRIGGHDILMDDWVSFLGIWMAEGYAGTVKRTKKKVLASGEVRRYKGTQFRVNIGIGKGHELVEELLSRLPFKFNKSKAKAKEGRANFYTFDCYSKELTSVLEAYGKQTVRFLPEYMFRVSEKQAQLYWKWHVLGDGAKREGHHRIYTSSFQLANDLQRLALHAGMCARILAGHSKGSERAIHGRTVKSTTDSYVVSFSPEREAHTQYSKLYVPYSGKVYCASVPNTTLYVRHNLHSMPVWTGNCAVDTQPELCFLIQNSWGPNAHGEQPDGPQGSCWITAAQFDRHVKNGGECFAFSNFQGFPARRLWEWV